MSVAQVTQPRLLQVGGGAVADVASVLRRISGTRALLVTDRYMVDSGTIERVTKPLDAGAISYDIFADTVPDPTTDVVDAGVARLKSGDYDCLVALGGGSPIDTAKAMAVLAANGGQMRDYKVPNDIPKMGLPLVAIPTTAGTGAEVTRFTVITDVERDEKMLIAGLACVPTAALIDYELTLTMPRRLTADTGIDSLTHAIEAYVSRRANPLSDMYARQAMALITANIRTACAEPGNHDARRAMMLGATLGGLAFTNASVALVHGMSRPIGAFFHVPHGLSNAMLLPVVTAFSAGAALSRYADCARAMGVVGAEVGDQAAVAGLLDELRRLNEELEVPTPRSYGIEEERWVTLLPTMAQQALASGSPGNNPRVPTAEEIIGLYQQAWS
ncbi:MAG: iron-containing alcohol dehydrogenase [Alphaproteobacteria bacterium]|nr:iron-containing alcohol dehydrogenase [Alphaproteobacteria bacterium]